MRIKNARIFQNGSFIPGGIEFDDKITAVGAGLATEDALDAEGCYLIPGLIDIHTHAAMGEDASDGKPEGMPVLSRYYAAGGVTSWCPTTMTLKEPVLTQAMHTIRDFVRPADGAKVAGVNPRSFSRASSSRRPGAGWFSYWPTGSYRSRKTSTPRTPPCSIVWMRPVAALSVWSPSPPRSPARWSSSGM